MSQATVSKELNRNADTRGRYSLKMAQMFADMMKKQNRHPYKFNDKMRALISDKLESAQIFGKNIFPINQKLLTLQEYNIIYY